jgi:hypothetical protein
MQEITETYENGITRTYTPKPCSACHTHTDPLALFPNDLCMACYAETPAAQGIPTTEDIKRMFGIA